MRTINKILRYNFSQKKIQEMIRDWIVNGCWGKWWFDFWKFIEDNIRYFPEFLQEKLSDFKDDLFLFCVEHDYDFHYKIGFYIANFYFARWIFYLTNWTTFWKRLSLSLIVFILLNRHWKKYYK